MENSQLPVDLLPLESRAPADRGAPGLDGPPELESAASRPYGDVHGCGGGDCLPSLRPGRPSPSPARKAVWDAIFILFVVWPALLLYQVTDHAGGYDALRQGITRFSRNELFIVVALGWVFSSFLQGIAGFGTPIAIVAPLLVAFGVRPVYAVAIPIIAHLWAKFFGTLGVSWFATLAVVDLADPVGPHSSPACCSSFPACSAASPSCGCTVDGRRSVMPGRWC